MMTGRSSPMRLARRTVVRPEWEMISPSSYPSSCMNVLRRDKSNQGAALSAFNDGPGDPCRSAKHSPGAAARKVRRRDGAMSYTRPDNGPVQADEFPNVVMLEPIALARETSKLLWGTLEYFRYRPVR